METLAARGLTQHDYATHMPHAVQKEKLREVYDTFDLHHATMLWEVCYGNAVHGEPRRTRPMFCRISKQHSIETLRNLTAAASIFNHTASSWCPDMRAFLEELMPEPAPSELDDAGQPAYRIVKKARKPVKRRPPETHRAFIEAQKQQ
jgi:hypothetical protein